MSKYTTEVRYICEQYYGLDESKDYADVDTIVENACLRIFEDFPIFDEEYRIPLEKKILRHYYTREICAETVGLWKLWLNNRMNEIMPYYNMLYRSALLDFDPLHDVDYTVNHTGNDSSNEGVESTSKNSGTVSYTKDTSSTTDDDSTKTYDTTVTNNNTATRTMNTTDTETGSIEHEYDTTDSETGSVTTTYNTVEGESGDITRTDNLTRNLTGTSSLERDTKSDSTTDTTDNTDFTGTKWEYFNDTPQGGVDRIDVVGLSNYLTNAKKTTDNTETDETIHSVNKTTGNETADTTNTETETNTGTVKENRDLDKTHTGTVTEQKDLKTTETGTVTDNISKSLAKTGTIGDQNQGTSATTGTVDDNRDVSTVEHSTNVGETEKTSNSNSTRAITSTNAYIERVTGKRNSLSYSELLLKFRQTFLNIDAMIIDELQDLFFNLW